MVAANSSEERRWGRTTRLRHGALLRAAREQAGMTAKEVCHRCGISAAQLSDIERGIGPLSLRRANQIAKVLGQPFVEIVQAVLQDKLEAAGFCGMRVNVGCEVDTPAACSNGSDHDEDIRIEDLRQDAEGSARDSRSLAR